MTNVGYESKVLDHLGIVAGICKEIELAKQIDEEIGSNGRKVSVGEAVQAMVINALGITNQTLYMSPNFFENKPVEKLVKEGIDAKDLNDDCLGRALDALYEKGITELFGKVSLKSLRHYGIEPKDYNLDSTSMALHGEYNSESEDEGVVTITNGYSRDEHPDLKQVVLSLICTHKSNLPIWLKVSDGNKVDKSLFPEIIDDYIEQMQTSEDYETPANSDNYWIADSALYSKSNIQELSSKGKWITRVPQTISEAKQLIFQTTEAQMQDVGNGYKLMDTTSDYGRIRQRWIVVESEKAHERHDKILEKKIAKVSEKVKNS